MKARASIREGVEAVGPAAERRIVAAADLWLAKHPDAADLDLRYDIVAVAPWRIPEHLPDAFRPNWRNAW